MRNWLSSRYYNVSLDGNNSYLYDCNVIGTVKGSILRPVLSSLFVSPLLQLEDNFALVWNKNKDILLNEMQKKIERIPKWLRESGFKVNENKTELWLFHKKDQPTINLTFNNQIRDSKKQMNILGVAFDSKLNWQIQIANTITTTKRALHAIYLIRKHFK